MVSWEVRYFNELYLRVLRKGLNELSYSSLEEILEHLGDRVSVSVGMLLISGLVKLGGREMLGHIWIMYVL